MKKIEVVRIHSKYLRIDPLTKRRTYDPVIEKQIEEDMVEHGFRIEKPLVVRPDPKRRGYWLITCGQHRFEIGLKCGIGYFPCVKKEFQNDVEAISEAYKDNKLFCQVDAVTEAEYFECLGRKLLKDRGHTDSSIESMRRKYPEELIALQMGVSTAYVKHRITLLNLPNLVKWMVRRYYMPSEKGLKLSPTIGEELQRIQTNLTMQKKALPESKIDVEEAVKKLALKFYREKVTLHEARKIGAEIAYLGYENWVTAKPVPIEVQGNVRCAKCGVRIENGVNPWLPLCTQHKYEFLAIRTKAENPHRPLHEINPSLHRLRVKDGNVLKPPSESASTIISSKGEPSIKDVNVLKDDPKTGKKQGTCSFAKNNRSTSGSHE